MVPLGGVLMYSFVPDRAAQKFPARLLLEPTATLALGTCVWLGANLPDTIGWGINLGDDP